MSASSVKARRILSLWLPQLPFDRLKRQLAQTKGCATPDDARSCVVVAKLNNALQILALNDTAARSGLIIGQPLADARAVCPELQVFDADEPADTQLLETIAEWCDRFTPLVALDPPDGLFLDISGCAHLFGGESNMMQTVCASLARQGLSVSAAIAGTAVCARTLSRVTSGRIVAEGDEAKAVSSFPVWALGANETIARGLRRAGLNTIGDVALRASHEITARFGAEFTSLLEQALGQSDAPISPRKPLPDYMVEKRFAEPVATTDAISAALLTLSQMLICVMDRAGKGARLLEASFFRTDGAVRSIGVQTGQPATQADFISRLFSERLDALADPLDPGFGFDLIRLSASRTEIVVQEQRDFDTCSKDNDEVAALIDRIAARVGGRRVVVHLPRDTHVPERASIAAPAQHYLIAASHAAWRGRTETEPPLRPLRLFERPEEINVIADFPHGPPAQFSWRRAQHRIARVEGPERIAMEWWTQSSETNPVEHKEARTRDYFRIEDGEGCRFWLYREGIYRREVTKFRWFMQGVFA